MSVFSVRIRTLRKTTGLTQKNIASKFGLTESLWKKYEAGDRTPTFDGLIALADYFDVSLDYLVGRSDNPKVNPEQPTERNHENERDHRIQRS